MGKLRRKKIPSKRPSSDKKDKKSSGSSGFSGFGGFGSVNVEPTFHGTDPSDSQSKGDKKPHVYGQREKRQTKKEKKEKKQEKKQQKYQNASANEGERAKFHPAGSTGWEKKDGYDPDSKYYIGKKYPGAIDMWKTGLSHGEKVEILDITAYEIIQYIKRFTDAELEINEEGLAKFVEDVEFLTKFRCAFDHSLCNDSPFVLPRDGVLGMMLHIMEEHLYTMYARKRMSIKLPFMVALLIWIGLWYNWIIRLVLCIVVILLGFYKHPRITTIVNTFLLLFEDTDLPKMESRFDSFWAAWLVCLIGSWVPWYAVVVIIAVMPMLMCEVNSRLVLSVDDMKWLPRIQSLLLVGCEVLLLYFSLYSIPLTLILFATFLPNIFLLVSSIVARFSAIPLIFLSVKVRPMFEKYIKNIGTWIVWLSCLYMIVFSDFSGWTWYIVCWCICLCTTPSIIATGISGLLVLYSGFVSDEHFNVFVVLHLVTIGMVIVIISVKHIIWDQCIRRLWKGKSNEEEEEMEGEGEG